MVKIDVTKKAVNSKSLVNEIDRTVQQLIHLSGGDNWTNNATRSIYVNEINDFLESLKNDGLITQFKILMDERNNTKKEKHKGIYHLDISFRQALCINTTKLHYRFKVSKDQATDDEDLV